MPSIFWLAPHLHPLTTSFSGDFVNDLNDEIHDFSDSKLMSVLRWRDFFRRSAVWVFEYERVRG